MFAEFFQENLLLFGILSTLIIVLTIDIIRSNFGNFKRVLPIDVPLLQRDTLFMLDINLEKDFQTGHIAGSTNIPAKNFSGDEKTFTAKIDEPILIIDQSGLSANPIAKKLADSGFKKVYVLSGGLAAWQKENFPLTQQ